MKIAAVADMHGDLRNVFRAIEACRPDLLLSCGDWGDLRETDPAAFRALPADVPVLTVYGNHDDIDFLSAAANNDGSPILMSPGEVRERDGLRFAGISGIWAKSHRKPYYVTDDDVAQIASGLAGRGVDVLVSHGCAIGLADTVPGGRHGGHRCFLNAFQVIAPRLYLCGHLHVAQEHVLNDGRIIVNVGYTCEGDYWTFEINQKEIEVRHHRL